MNPQYIPLLSVYIVGLLFPVRNTRMKDIPFRPPGWVFGIVWPILLLLIGYSWKTRPMLQSYYILLTALLCSWLLIFSFNKKYALYTIFATILLTAFLIVYSFKKNSSYSLIPLLLWLIFASYLSYHLV